MSSSSTSGATTYTDYSSDRIGWFFGISGGQLVFLATGRLPIFWAITAVRDHILKLKGYDAGLDFITQQQRMMEQK